MGNKREPTEGDDVKGGVWQYGYDPEKTLGETLKRLRVARGMSQEDIAQMMNMAGFTWRQTTVAKTEGGSRPVRVNEAAALALCFGVSVNDLLGTTAETPQQVKIESAYRATFSASISTRLRAGEAQRQAEAARREYEESIRDLREMERLHEEARRAFDEAFDLAGEEAHPDGEG
ncbi:helix-turn-helix domain-containing protein [Actinomadura nitritigenes]|uniref:helix-turn-helix domain-containing protein n=1 Tax=Actinomadura nitritigenes TaxID=134602 RepID=UPI003D8D3687